jgi:hypothetical protein
MLLRDSDFEVTLSHIYFKKWDNESDFAFCNPKRYENYLNI